MTEYLKWDWQSPNSGLLTCQLSGFLNVWSVSKNYLLLQREIQVKSKSKSKSKSYELMLDCKNLTEIDSAGVAFLLSFLRMVSGCHGQPKIKNLSQRALDLIAAQGVKDLFKLYLI